MEFEAKTKYPSHYAHELKSDEKEKRVEFLEIHSIGDKTEVVISNAYIIND